MISRHPNNWCGPRPNAAATASDAGPKSRPFPELQAQDEVDAITVGEDGVGVSKVV